MMRSRLSGWREGSARRTLRTSWAGAALGLALWAAACGGTYKADPIPGGSKGPEMKTSMTHGERTGSASQMNQSTTSTPSATGTLTPLPPCGPGLPCTGMNGCTSGCVDAGVITSCQACDNTAYTDCTQSACVP